MEEFSDILVLFNLFILVFRIYCYISISFLPFVLYYSFFETRYKPNSNYYHRKEWYHFLKVLWARPAVNKFKQSFADAVKKESDESLEQPRKLTTFMRSDTQTIFGVDQAGNSLYLRITLREKRLAESCVQIRLADGSIFQLPEHPLILISSIPERKWQAGGLEFTVVEAFSLLQITYNGFLRNTIRNDENEETGDVIHCSFNFMWTASTEVKFFPQDVSTSELAEAVAVEPWRDAKWIKLLGFHTGYDQHGTLEGYFTYSTPFTQPPGTSLTPAESTAAAGVGSGYTETQLRLSASRRRVWGPGEARALHRMLTLYAADSRGGVFSVGVRSYARGCKELHFGSALLPNKKILFIEDCDISLPDFFEDGIIPGAFSFSFKVGGKLYECTAFTHNNSIADMRNEESTGYYNKLVKTEYMINGEEASGYGVFWYRHKGKGMDLPPYIIRPGIQTIEPERKYVASLKSPECRSVYLAGCKGTNLALLTAVQTDQFHTLDGFCILAPALEKYLEKNSEIKEELKKLNDISCGVIEGNLEDTCKRVQQLFTTTRLSQLLQDLVVREITLLKMSLTATSTESSLRWCWAVRSSSVHRDTSVMSSVAKEQTYLDSFSEEDVLVAITSCWGSVYEIDKVEYRRNHGLPVICEMAVVIQHTLDTDTAGVLTTNHPETGTPAQMTVSANYGLGMSVNSRTITPDEAIVSRSWNGRLSVLATSPGTKTHKIVITDEGIAKVGNNNGEGMCVSKEQLVKLARAGLEVEKALGGPQKIAWGFYKDHLYFISTSPLPPVLLHQSSITLLQHHKDAVLQDATEWTVAPRTPCSALSGSTILRHLYHALHRVAGGKGCGRGVAQRSGDVYQTILRFVDKEITEELKIHALVSTGRNFVSEELHQEALFRNGVVTWTDTILSSYRNFTYCWNNKDNAEEAIVLSQAMKLTPHQDATVLEHFRVINRNLDLLRHIVYLHAKVNKSYMFYRRLFLNLVYDEKTGATPSELQHLLDHYSTSSIYHTASRVELLAAVLHCRDLGPDFSVLPPGAAVPWLERHASDCFNLLEKIMGKIGCRGVNEFDFTSEPWENNTFALIRIVQKIIQRMEKENKTESQTCEEIVGKPAKLQNKLNGRVGAWLDARLHASCRWRERSLEAVAGAVNKFRVSYLDLGRRLQLLGRLPHPRLALQLTHLELEALVHRHRPDLLHRAVQRAILHKTTNPNIPDTLTATVLPSLQSVGTTFEQQKQLIIGSTVVGGHVAGRVCVLENISQVDLIQPDDILVTKYLDLGWSPYFGLISGLICDTGSIISQGAIAVYKKNVPCIIAKDATKVFKTGDQVMLIGNTGVVEKILSN